VKTLANCRLIARWRSVEADVWDRAHLDLCGPAALTITAQGGEIASAPWRLVSKSNMRTTRSASAGPVARKATRSRAKEPPNSSMTAPSRSSSPIAMATKPSSRPNGILLQQPARIDLESEPRHLA
jgi:hypothetical protein